MPAAAVIPAPIAYIKVVAVKKLVVEFLGSVQCPSLLVRAMSVHPSVKHFLVLHLLAVGAQIFYLEKIRVFQAGLRLNTLAWNNRIGL